MNDCRDIGFGNSLGLLSFVEQQPGTKKRTNNQCFAIPDIGRSMIKPITPQKTATGATGKQVNR